MGHEHHCCCNENNKSNGHCHEQAHGESESGLKPIFLSVALLVVIGGVNYFTHWWGIAWLETIAYIVAFLPVGIPVLREAWELLHEEHSFFNECALMSIATIGAFALGDYLEAVMLLLLYQIGEYLQGKAVHRARKDISQLADVRSDTVLRVQNDQTTEIPATEAQVGDTLRVLAGMRVSLDGLLLSDNALLDQSALTGESMPIECERGDLILAGSVVSSRAIEIEVSKPYEDSTLAHIIQMTEEASERKPVTERMIRRFAKVYTPIIFGLALLVVVVPWLVSLFNNGVVYDFSSWFYRALVFLVVSCPCALVISVPLTYFSGLGATGRHGLLFKGAIYLEELRRVSAVVFDKTGTLTEGRFEVKELRTSGIEKEQALSYIAAVEAQSKHPMAIAIQRHREGIAVLPLQSTEEVTGMGLKAVTMDGTQLLVGSEKLMLREGLEIPQALRPNGESAVLLALNGAVVAVVTLVDSIKGSSRRTIEKLHHLGISNIVMLSGDKASVVANVAEQIGISDARGDLLPDDKMNAVEQLMKRHRVAFVGDGLNDAPVMSMSHIGIAMGGIGSDATIEAADVVIQGTDPHKVVEGIEISRYTHKIVLQNIIFALGFKMVVMILAIFGIASLSLAVLADVGVTLLAVLNALRALYFKASK